MAFSEPGRQLARMDDSGAVPALGASAPRRGFIRRLVTRTPFEERVRIVAASAQLEVLADDDGIVEVQLSLANLSRKRLTVERFHCEQWLWNGNVLPSVEPHFRGIGTTVEGKSFGECWLTFHLTPGIVRRMRTALIPAPNRLSSVEAQLEVLGKLWFTRRREPMWLRLTPPNAFVRTPWATGE